LTAFSFSFSFFCGLSSLFLFFLKLLPPFQNRLTSDQKKKVSEFEFLTSASNEMSINYLKTNNWNLEQAADNYFSNPPPSAPKVDKAKIQQLFEKYAVDGKIQATGAEGTGAGLEQFISDLGISSDDIALFVFAWKLKAKVLGEFSKQEFDAGLQELRVDTIEGLRDLMEPLRAQIAEEENFKRFYAFLFDYALNKETNQKFLDLSEAIELWKIILKGRFVQLDKWCKFLEERYRKSISKDTWNQLFEFVRVINNDLDKYDPEGAWPVVIDEFVEHVKKQRLQQFHSSMQYSPLNSPQFNRLSLGEH